MAENFLSQLLRMENSVQSDESQQCFICMSEIGTLCSESGVIECAIRLPCHPDHKVGSACIARWLKSNNTCPMCRHPLFPLTEDDTDEDEVEPVSSAADNEEYIEFRRVEMARTARISENVRTYCVALHLNGSVIRRAQFIGDIATRMFSLTGRSETSVAAASVYLASHLCRQPKRLRDIAELVGSTEGAIQATYRRLYAYYRSSTSYGREIFGYPLDHAAAEDGQSSSLPPLEHEFVDGENGQDEEFIQELWSRFSAELHLQPAITTIARRMAYKLETLGARALSGSDAKSIVSISIYLASYTAGAPVSHDSIAEVAGFHPSWMVAMYAEMYDDREQLLDSATGPAILPFPPRPWYMATY